MERLSLKRQLNRRLILLMTFLVLITTFLFVYGRQLQLNQMVETAMETMALDVQHVYVDATLSKNGITASTARRYLKKIETESAVIQIENAKGLVVASTGPLMPLPEGSGDLTEASRGGRDPQNPNLTVGFSKTIFFDHKIKLYIMPLINQDAIVVGRVKVATDVTKIGSVMLREGCLFFLVAVTIGMMIIGLTTWFLKSIIERLEALKQISQAFATRQFDKEAVTQPYDEIGQLGEVMNFMASSWQVQHAERADYFAQTAHDLKTPLTIMMTWVDYLRTSPEEFEEGLDVIYSEAEKLRHMADVILSAHAEGEEALFLTRVSVAKFIYDEMAKWQFVLQRHQVSINYNLAAFTAVFDQYKMGQVLFNLVDNVIRHTPPKTEIHIETKFDLGQWTLIFKDTGQAQNRQDKTMGEGFGLGLKSVQKIVEHHGGKVSWLIEDSLGMTITAIFPQNPTKG